MDSLINADVMKFLLVGNKSILNYIL